MPLPPTHPHAAKYRLLDAPHLQDLANDIAENGQIDPVVFSSGPASPGLLIDGRNRWLACELAGRVPEIDRIAFESEEDIVAFIEGKNVHRRHLTPEEQEAKRQERIAHIAELRSEGKSLRMIAKETGVSLGQVQRDLSTVSPDTVELPTTIIGIDGKERQAQRPAPSPAGEHQARRLLISNSTERAERSGPSLYDAAIQQKEEKVHAAVEFAPRWYTKGEPISEALLQADASGAWMIGVDSSPVTLPPTEPPPLGDQKKGVANGRSGAEFVQLVETNRAKRHEEIAAQAKAAGLYSVLYVDPPWQYTSGVALGSNRLVTNHYATLSHGDLLELPISNICNPDAVLYLWTTAPCAGEAFEVLRAWGFNYKTQMVWVKGGGMGMGHWARIDHELLYIATRGEFPTPPTAERVSSIIEAPRGRHSAKPGQVRDLIESMYTPHPKVEIFARESAPGWTSLGNEIDGRDIRDVLREPKKGGA